MLKNIGKIAAFLVGIILLTVLYATWEVYFTWDSVHYMSLFVTPVNGDTHPLFFGFYLGFLNFLGNLTQQSQVGLDLYILIQSILFLGILYFAKPNVSDLRSLNWRMFLLGSLFCFIIVPVLVIFKIAVWTETIFLFLICVLAFLFEKWQQDTQKIRWSNLGFLVVVGMVLCNVRYQGAIPVFALILSMLLSVLLLKVSKTKFVISVCSLLVGIFFLSKVLSFAYPSIHDSSAMKLNGIQVSLKCTLRCQSKAVAGYCGEPDQVESINKVSCSDVLFGIQKMYSIEPKNSLSEVIQLEGFTNMALWLIKAPVIYFMDRHLSGGLEIGPTNLESEEASGHYVEAFEFFKKQFNSKENKRSGLFYYLSEYFNFLFVKSWIINLLSATVLLLAIWSSVLSRKPISLFWALSSFGSLLSFTYFVPHTPFRFLIQIIFLGYMAIKMAMSPK